MEDDKRDLISREISKFRDTHKKLEEEKDKREKERLEEVSRDRDKKRDQEDEEEAYDRRKLERKLRDKEAAYQERLKNWELRERKKARDYAKEAERDDERRREMVKEGKRGSALQKRLRDREKETEADERDRKREKEELEEIRQRLLDEGHPNPDAELRRMEEEEEERRRQPPIIPEPEPEEERKRHKGSREHRDRRHEQPRPEPAARPVQSDNEVEEGEEEEFENDEENPDVKPCLKPTMRPITTAPSWRRVPKLTGGRVSLRHHHPPRELPPDALPQEENRPKIGLSLKLGASGSPSQPNVIKRKKLPGDSVFDKFDDEETSEQPRKRKLVPLDYDDDKSLGVDGASSIKGANTEENTLMDRRVRPWINKKIIEYIGEEEATLVDFVCTKVMAHSMPQSILDDVAMVLDEEAEVFIVKMWRLLIYETEAKKIGLVK
ncbi:hypothetical protein F7725_019769 [Dissostichus mawsoni]|uniref:PWI domain-containing protein n=1 Tax=Dissostichus mawsoni TaxID=36200 RepID=A0A7J5YL04_DISMA|nr:hypothetical protein F7725_019769 [Dissostichus mawsoni]